MNDEDRMAEVHSPVNKIRYHLLNANGYSAKGEGKTGTRDDQYVNIYERSLKLGGESETSGAESFGLLVCQVTSCQREIRQWERGIHGTVRHSTYRTAVNEHRVTSAQRNYGKLSIQ